MLNLLQHPKATGVKDEGDSGMTDFLVQILPQGKSELRLGGFGGEVRGVHNDLGNCRE
jgi:hypothetical protein